MSVSRKGSDGGFSLVSGGPLFRLWRRTGLTDDDMNMVGRRVLVAVLLTWVPLLLLSMYEGRVSTVRQFSPLPVTQISPPG